MACPAPGYDHVAALVDRNRRAIGLALARGIWLPDAEAHPLIYDGEEDDINAKNRLT